MSSDSSNHFLFKHIFSLFNYSTIIDELFYPIEHICLVSGCVDELFSDDTNIPFKYHNLNQLPEICYDYADEIS